MILTIGLLIIVICVLIYVAYKRNEFYDWCDAAGAMMILGYSDIEIEKELGPCPDFEK